jgi:WD40 repeat protein
MVAAVGSTGDAYVMSKSGGPPLYQLGDASTASDAIAFSPDGKIFAVAQDGVNLWSTSTRRSLPALPQASPRTVAFSPNGQTLAVGDASGTIYLWSTATWHITGQIKCPITSWGGLVFSPNGKTLAAYADPYSGNLVYLYSINY